MEQNISYHCPHCKNQVVPASSKFLFVKNDASYYECTCPTCIHKAVVYVLIVSDYHISDDPNDSINFISKN